MTNIWRVKVLNIVVPMAGRGSRFVEAGYTLPKPLIPIYNKPMIEVVIDNLRPKLEHRFIFICQQEHIKKYQIDELLRSAAPGCEVVSIDGITEGAACTVLMAKSLINSGEPLMVANSDQYVDIDINEYLSDMEGRSLDGLIMTMKANDPKWSYAAMNSDNFVIEVKEKVVISSEATVGIYNFSSGRDFCAHAQAMIDNKELQNGEYYVAPVYNRFIADGSKIGVFNIGEEADGMYGLGIPEDLELFRSLGVLKHEC